MYSRNVNGKTRRFGVSGQLWHGVLVMFDRETESYWTQLDGRAIRGEEQGARLEHVPSVFTTFGQWVDAHPDTLVLNKPPGERQVTGSNYASYFADPDRLFLEHLGDGIDTDQVALKDVVFGVRLGTAAVAVSEATMEREGLVNIEVDGQPVALLRNTLTGEVRGVLRNKDGRVLELASAPGFEATERVIESGTGASVDVSELVPVRVDRAFWYAWARTIPGARVLVP